MTDNYTAEVFSSQDSFVKIRATCDTAFKKNEVVYICPKPAKGERQERLKAEILRVKGNEADVQVFEDTSGIAPGDPVAQTHEMLAVELAPGNLGTVFDGLQQPLNVIADEYGFFLPRGVSVDAIDRSKKWDFTPKVKVGDKVRAGDALGSVPEGQFDHKIMAPFDADGELEVVSITKAGSYTVEKVIAVLRDEQGNEKEQTMIQKWAVRKPVAAKMRDDHTAERLYPSEPLVTTIRLIDTFFPIARGGTACIPGPFGAGKTVLQSLVSRYSSADIVIVVACGERAGEVVETITEFPEMVDPKTGGMLMDKTIIICNTSSMPVAAREASIYTGVTLGEYYRQMGYDVLLLADSTSRWAQALRETSGRLEEIPGEEAFPAYLDSGVKAIYERAGVIRNNEGVTGSLTMIGTVSPAGGNFEEPVTQSTLRTVKCFLGLSAARAYKRFYPAVDPLISWSRYSEQVGPWFEENVEKGWTDTVERYMELIRKADGIYQMMQVTGEEGISFGDFITYQKALMLDMVYLQQDAYDKVDVSVPLERQKVVFAVMRTFIDRDYFFETKDEARSYFIELTGVLKNWNYSVQDSADYKRLLTVIEAMAEKGKVKDVAAA